MPLKRRSSRILNQDFKSSAPPEFMEISDTESEHLEEPAPQPSQQKSSGTRDFRFENITQVWKNYQRLKQRNASAEALRQCLKDNHFRSETHLVQKYTAATGSSKVPIFSKGKEKVGEASTPPTMKSVSPKSLSSSKIVVPEDDSRFFEHFEMKIGIASGVHGTGGLFRSAEHNTYYKVLLARGVMNHRTVDFACLEKAGFRVKHLFEKQGIYEFCLQSAEVYTELTAYFYSNLSILSPNWLQFTVGNKKFDIKADMLARIMGARYSKFIPLEVSYEEASRVASEDSSFALEPKRHTSYSDLSRRSIILHKIIINCLKPKAASKTDLSKSELKLIWALLKGQPFSLPHTIIFHMYRTLQKDKGQLPYGALISRIFMFLQISIPDELTQNSVPRMFVGESMLSKMKQFDDIREKFKGKETVHSEGTSSAKSRFRKSEQSKGAGSQKKETPEKLKVYKKRKILLQDENDNAEADHLHAGHANIPEHTAEPNPEQHYTAHVSEEQAPAQGEFPQEASQGFDQTEHTNVQGESSSNQNILSILLEIKGKQSALEQEVKNLKKIVEENNHSQQLQAAADKAELKEAIVQCSSNMEKAVGQCSSKIEEAVSILDNFQLIRTPSKS